MKMNQVKKFDAIVIGSGQAGTLGFQAGFERIQGGLY